MRVRDIAGFGEAAGRDLGAGDAGDAVAYTIAEFARRVGLSESSVVRRIRDGRIRAVKIGRLVRIPASEMARLFG